MSNGIVKGLWFLRKNTWRTRHINDCNFANNDPFPKSLGVLKSSGQVAFDSCRFAETSKPKTILFFNNATQQWWRQLRIIASSNTIWYAWKMTKYMNAPRWKVLVANRLTWHQKSWEKLYKQKLFSNDTMGRSGWYLQFRRRNWELKQFCCVQTKWTISNSCSISLQWLSIWNCHHLDQNQIYH